MAILSSNKGVSKNDINFFAAFTESARKAARALAYVIVLGLVIFGIFLVWLIADAIRNATVSSQIASLRAELAGPEYEGLEREAVNLQQEITKQNQYYFALTSMQQTVTETPVASVDIVDLLGESIPNDSYVAAYEISGTEATISGYTFNYYSALNMVNMIESADVFEDCDISVTVAPDPTFGDLPDNTVNPIDVYYEFTVTGTLTREAFLSVVRFYDDVGAVVALGGVESQSYHVGDTYSVDEISTYVDTNGTEYTLSAVAINGTIVNPEQLAIIVEDGYISGTIQQNMDIELHYSVAAEATEGGEE